MNKVPWPKFAKTSFFETILVFRRFRVKDPRHSETILMEMCYLYRRTRRMNYNPWGWAPILPAADDTANLIQPATANGVVA